MTLPWQLLRSVHPYIPAERASSGAPHLEQAEVRRGAWWTPRRSFRSPSVLDAGLGYALDQVALEEGEDEDQGEDGDRYCHEEFVDVDGLGRDERRHRDLNRPGGRVLADHQRPEERVPVADEGDSGQRGEERQGVRYDD